MPGKEVSIILPALNEEETIILSAERSSSPASIQIRDKGDKGSLLGRLIGRRL